MRALANQARHRKTGHIHECQELVNLPYSEDGEWECVDERCCVRLYPCAWKPEKRYKVAPYFRLGQGSKHELNCFVQGLEELAAEGRKRRISSDRGFPVPYPNRILLAPRRVAVDNPDASESELDTVEERSKNLGTRSGPGSLHDRTFRSIREACWFFVTFPYDRHLKLDVQGCEGTRYDDIFVRIGREFEADIGPKRILYGEMKFRSEPISNGDKLTITLLDKVASPGRRERERRVIVDMAGWPQHLRNYLRQQIGEALAESRRAHENGDRHLCPWLFFVGAQKVLTQDLFQVPYYPAVAILACQMPKVPQATRKARRPELPPSPGPETVVSYLALPSRNPVGLRDRDIKGYQPVAQRHVRAIEEAVPAPAWSHPQLAVKVSFAAEPSAQPIQLPKIRAVLRSSWRWFLSFIR